MEAYWRAVTKHELNLLHKRSCRDTIKVPLMLLKQIGSIRCRLRHLTLVPLCHLLLVLMAALLCGGVLQLPGSLATSIGLCVSYTRRLTRQ